MVYLIVTALGRKQSLQFSGLCVMVYLIAAAPLLSLCDIIISLRRTLKGCNIQARGFNPGNRISQSLK